jgi:hypothetical protein
MVQSSSDAVGGQSAVLPGQRQGMEEGRKKERD